VERLLVLTRTRELLEPEPTVERALEPLAR